MRRTVLVLLGCVVLNGSPAWAQPARWQGRVLSATSTMKTRTGRPMNPDCKPCHVTIYTEGVLTYDRAGDTSNPEPPDLRRHAVGDSAGVEFDPRGASGPPPYNRTGAGCGALLLWSRER